MAAACTSARTFATSRAVARGELKSRSIETTFDYDIADIASLEQVLAEQSTRLGAELRERSLRGRTIGIKVRLDDWTTVTRVHTIAAPTDDGQLIAATALSLLRAYAPAATGAADRGQGRRLRRSRPRRSRRGQAPLSR